MRVSEPSIAREQIEILGFLNSLQTAFTEFFDDALLSLANFFHVDANVAAMHAKIRSAPREIRNARAIEHRLRRRAAIVDARAANVSAFNQRRLPARFPKRRGQRFSPLARTNNDCIVVIHVTYQFVSEPRAVATGSFIICHLTFRICHLKNV